jgi:hypothetical protein
VCASCALGDIRMAPHTTVELVVLRHPCGPGPAHSRGPLSARRCWAPRPGHRRLVRPSSWHGCLVEEKILLKNKFSKLLPICDRPSTLTSYSICDQQHILTTFERIDSQKRSAAVHLVRLWLRSLIKSECKSCAKALERRRKEVLPAPCTLLRT